MMIFECKRLNAHRWAYFTAQPLLPIMLLSFDGALQDIRPYERKFQKSPQRAKRRPNPACLKAGRPASRNRPWLPICLLHVRSRPGSFPAREDISSASRKDRTLFRRSGISCHPRTRRTLIGRSGILRAASRPA